MPSADTLGVRPAGEVFVPDYLGPEDHPWLDALLDELRQFEGEPLRDWRARAGEPLRARAPERRRRLATGVLERLCGVEDLPDDPSPAEVRAHVFGAAQRARDEGPMDRDFVLASCGADLELPVPDLLARLFADLPGERRLRLPESVPDARGLALLTNLRLSQALLRSASQVEVRLASRSRALIRQILFLRLLCTVRPTSEGVRVDVSGPLTLLRHTTLYGRALAALVPVLRGAESFTILARCAAGVGERTVRLTSADPIFPPGVDPPRYDSKLEERFARDFGKRAPEWDLLREPEPVPVGGAYVFPDFALQDRRDGRRTWLLEIVGFWTPDYLAAKLDRLRRSGRRDIIVCVDEKLGCRDEDLPPDLPVVRFRNRVDMDAVLRILEGPPPPAAPPPEPERLLLGTESFFLDFAGRRAKDDPVHARLASLRPGDPLSLTRKGSWILVTHPDGTAVAALSGAARDELAVRLPRVEAVRVHRVVERTKEHSAPGFRPLLQVERWRVPLVEVAVGAWTPSDGAGG